MVHNNMSACDEYMYKHVNVFRKALIIAGQLMPASATGDAGTRHRS
jgi:hypothetical protein